MEYYPFKAISINGRRLFLNLKTNKIPNTLTMQVRIKVLFASLG